MYVPKQAFAWLFVVGAGLFGWWLWWSSDHQGGEPVTAAAEQPAAPEPLTLRLTIVTPDGETTKEVKVQTDPVSNVAPARQGDQDLTVLAHDGAIVYLGDDGKLTANTGDVQTSGAVTIDSEGSTLQTGQSTVTGTVRAEDGEVVNEFAPHLGDRAVAIAGYENHSVNVAGNDQIVTYDDSNVYINRNGEIMGNTGGAVVMAIIDSHVEAGDAF